MSMARAMTIAGSDSGGGAGIQADLKTFMALGVFGTSALTAVTAQNTLGVQGVYPLTAEQVVAQMDAVLCDIGTDAAKTGMLFDAEIIAAVADRLTAHQVIRLVVDPVMVAKGGHRLLQPSGEEALRRRLLPLAAVVTPNLPEAEALTGRRVRSRAGMEAAARMLVDMGAGAAVVKGGHLEGEAAADLYFDGSTLGWLEAPRCLTRHTHGTGCTFSAAIAAGLAQGRAPLDAVAKAKEFITRAIRKAPGLGGGRGPVDHLGWREVPR